MNVILGLDVSTSKVGLSIIDPDHKLVDSQAIKLNNKISLESRCSELEDVLLYYKNSIEYEIVNVYVEQPFMMFSGGKTTAMTMSKLQRFNGMVCYMIKKLFGYEAELIAANKARGTVGLKIKRGENTKQKVIEWVKQKYPKEFVFELTRHGNPKPGTDDKADAVIVGLAGLMLNS